VNLGLKDKVAVVAASSGGLGYATALLLAQEGCHVAICGRDEEKLNAAARSIEDATGRPVFAQVVDVSHHLEARGFVQRAYLNFQRLDIVIANAGGPPSAKFVDTTFDMWEEAVQGILLSTVALFQAAIPLVQFSSKQGRFIAITSLGAKQPLKDLVLSNSTRAAIHGLVKTLSKELAGNNITVNAVCPATIGTDRQVELAKQTAAREGISLEIAMKRRVSAVPLGRMGDPSEFAAGVAFLCSEQAAFITGTSLVIDGGSMEALP
jgi:3-oxoacyl-[acyl-carrier protein] reductase